MYKQLYYGKHTHTHGYFKVKNRIFSTYYYYWGGESKFGLKEYKW